MAYFECIFGGALGNSITLVVTCASAFAGLTISCSDGVTTLTDTCPSSSPYEITFNLPNTGTWTVSGTISGSTYNTVVTVTDYETELINIPDGSTVTPTDDIQTWLNCANIWDKTTYTTISDVLSDTTTLLALISDNNACDYMARSTTWASSVCADSTAMTYIGADNYCADTLLDDSTWLNAICNSTYYQNVLNTKVPTMTSNTQPSGVASVSTYYSANSAAWKALDKSTSTYWAATSTTNQWLRYRFTSSVRVNKVEITNNTQNASRNIKNFSVRVSTNGTDFTPVTETLSNPNTTSKKTTYIFSNSNYGEYWEVYVVNNHGDSREINVAEVQFYGRAAT